jgi:hypothetical protein
MANLSNSLRDVYGDSGPASPAQPDQDQVGPSTTVSAPAPAQGLAPAAGATGNGAEATLMSPPEAIQPSWQRGDDDILPIRRRHLRLRRA